MACRLPMYLPWREAAGGGDGVEKRGLIVDGDESVLRHLKLALRARGWEVATASDLDEAESAFAGFSPTVVVAELHLTSLRRSEGLDLLQRVKRIRPETRVVVMAGLGSPEAERAALEVGAEAVIFKPFELRPFLDRLDSLCPSDLHVEGSLA